MKKLLIAFLLVSACSVMFAETLEEKVARLEKRIADLEEKLKPQIEQAELLQRIEPFRQKARERAQMDKEFYPQEKLNEVEALYQTWRKAKDQDEREAIVNTLMEKYPKANRTGCAFLYLAQASSGEKQIELLKQAIRDYGDCFYFDGVQVGAFARYYLFHIYNKAGNKVEAEKYAAELKASYPDAIGHDSRTLVDQIPK